MAVLSTAIHHLIERSAARAPEQTAIVHRDTRLSYAELDRRANRLAHKLRSRGVGRETLVGLHAERAPEAVIGLLAVLKAGGAYLPLAADYPPARVSSIMESAGARVLLAGPAQAPLFPDAIPLARDWQDWPDTAPDPVSEPDDLALVLYTSGSTGAPKGVMITHANLVSNVQSWEATHAVSALTALAQTAHFSFAVFQSDVFRALGLGITLVICPPEVLRSPGALLALLRRERVGMLEAVPSLVRMVLAYAPERGERLDTLRELVVSADRWYVREQRAAAALLPEGARLSHVYGLTETTFDSTWQDGTMPGSNPNDLAPIGRPFPHVQAYVLGPDGHPAPTGVEGELYVGGAGVARGYRGRPDLTEERFVRHPATPDRRLYRTGDLARVLPDGSIGLLGRADLQVKVRGFRVELGEVEGALEAHPGVAQAVVQAFEMGEERRLIAFYVSAAPLSSAALRGFLGENLPEFMLPAEFVHLPALPLTPSGKVDRTNLRLPEPAPPPVAPPLLDLDGIMRLIVLDALGAASVSDTERLDARGLDSLGMSSILAGVESAFGITVEPEDITPSLFESLDTLRHYVRRRVAEVV